jgi:hypothetical protein
MNWRRWQLGVTNVLHHEVASEAARRLNDDGPHAVGLDPFEPGREARACVDGIGTAQAAS